MILKPNFMKKSTKSLLLIREKIVKKKTGIYYLWAFITLLEVYVNFRKSDQNALKSSNI